MIFPDDYQYGIPRTSRAGWRPRLWTPFELNVTLHLRVGTHRLTIAVTNPDANHLTRDEPERRRPIS